MLKRKIVRDSMDGSCCSCKKLTTMIEKALANCDLCGTMWCKDGKLVGREWIAIDRWTRTEYVSCDETIANGCLNRRTDICFKCPNSSVERYPRKG